MTTKKSAVPALRLNLGGAPLVWHTLGEYPGLYHPVIAVPVDVVGGDEDWAKQLDSDKGCPVELVMLDEDEADEARKASADASGQSRRGVMNAAKRGASGAQADRVLAEHAAGKGE